MSTELQLIGTILLNDDLHDIINNIPEIFIEHKKFFQVLKELKSSDIQISIDSIRSKGIEQNYIDNVINNGKQRDLYDSLFSKQVMWFLDYRIRDIHNKYQMNTYKDYKEILRDLEMCNIEIHNNIDDTYTNDNLYEMYYKKTKDQRVKTGFDYFDIFGGVRKTTLIIIGARPGKGKTALLTQLVENDKRNKYKVGIVSHEEHPLDLVQRRIANATLVDENEIDLKEFTRSNESVIAEHIDRNNNAEIYYNKDMSQDIDITCRMIKKWVHKYGVQKVHIDYLQIIPSIKKFNTKVMKIEYVLEKLRTLKNELQINIICLAQLNRNIEQKSNDARPTMSDLKDCGQIEQDGELIILIHEKMKVDIFESEIELIIAKARKMPTGVINCRFKKNISKITEKIDYK